MISKIRADKTLKHAKIIVFTANTAEDQMMRAFDNGVDAYLTKPVSLKLLRNRIDNLIHNTSKGNVSVAQPKNIVTPAIQVTPVTPDTIDSNVPSGSQSRRYSKEEQHFMLKCRNVIDENLRNPDFSIDVFAQRMAMSHSSLYKKIKQMTGMSLVEFINDYRIYKATQLFRGGETSVKLVADACGVSDPKTFRNLFKKYMKISPKEYMQGFMSS